jgi:hypothetical protein
MERSGSTIEYDIRGQICPSTLLIALREINRNSERLLRGEISLVSSPTTVMQPRPCRKRRQTSATSPK